MLEYIATVVSSNIRELEGALIRVSAFASLNRSALDISLAQTVLRDIIDTAEDNIISPTDIITATAQYFKLTVDDLYGSSRSQQIATARQIAMYLCRERTSLSAEDRAAVRQPGSHHGHVCVQEDQRAHEGAPLDLQPGHGDHHATRPSLTEPEEGRRPSRTAPFVVLDNGRTSPINASMHMWITCG